MMTKYLKQAFLLLFVFAFISCNNSKGESGLENNRPMRYDVTGFFSVDQNKLTVVIPTTSPNIKVSERAYNISSSDINAFLIVVDDLESDDCTGLGPAKYYVTKTYTISDYWDRDGREELTADKELKIIVLNNNGTNIQSLVRDYKNCISTQNSYRKESCLYLNGRCLKITPNKQEIEKRPNEDGGDIIVGG